MSKDGTPTKKPIEPDEKSAVLSIFGASSVEEAKENYNLLQEQIRSLTSSMSNLQAQLAAKTEENEILEAKLQVKETELTTALEKTKVLEARIQILEEENLYLQEALDSLQNIILNMGSFFTESLIQDIPDIQRTIFLVKKQEEEEIKVTATRQVTSDETKQTLAIYHTNEKWYAQGYKYNGNEIGSIELKGVPTLKPEMEIEALTPYLKAKLTSKIVDDLGYPSKKRQLEKVIISFKRIVSHLHENRSNDLYLQFFQTCDKLLSVIAVYCKNYKIYNPTIGSSPATDREKTNARKILDKIERTNIGRRLGENPAQRQCLYNNMRFFAEQAISPTQFDQLAQTQTETSGCTIL